MTLVLTERGTIVVELAKELQDEIKGALNGLKTSEEEGDFAALLQRAIAGFTKKLSASHVSRLLTKSTHRKRLFAEGQRGQAEACKIPCYTQGIGKATQKKRSIVAISTTSMWRMFSRSTP
jgi:hypothetical protein